MTENEIYSRPMQVVSKQPFVCLFFARGPHQKLRVGITRDGAIISMDPNMALEPTHYWKRSECI